MSRKALVVIDIQNDITKHYREIIDRINDAINWAVENGLWAVCLKDTGEMIGDCGLTLQNINGEILPEIGYHICRDCQRKGYARDAFI